MNNLVFIDSTRAVLFEYLNVKYRSGFGTGIYIGDGLVLTNYHVTPMNTVSIRIYTEAHGWMKSEGLVKYSKTYDIALIKVPDLNLPKIEIQDWVKIGDTVQCYTAPWGEEAYSVNGVVMAYRTMDASSLGIGFLNLSTSIAAAPGFSGSGIYNEDNKLVGIISGTLSAGSGEHKARYATYGACGYLIRRLIESDIECMDDEIGHIYLSAFENIVTRSDTTMPLYENIKTINGNHLTHDKLRLKDFIEDAPDVNVQLECIWNIFNAGDVVHVNDRDITLNSAGSYLGTQTIKVIDDLIICDFSNDFMVREFTPAIMYTAKYGRLKPLIAGTFDEDLKDLIGWPIVNYDAVDQIPDGPVQLVILYRNAELTLNATGTNKYYHGDDINDQIASKNKNN